ncbi:MAG: hypothetical protein GX046_05865 [Tissierellia bacterium]|nr:hypothetical protein [Tissierellia bacterium]
MDLKETIKNLINVDIQTSDLGKLLRKPEKYVTSEGDLEKLNELFRLIKLTEKARSRK